MCSMCMRDSVDLVFLEFITEPLGIGFVIIKIDAYRLRSVFWPITVRFDRFDLIGLVDLKH